MSDFRHKVAIRSGRKVLENWTSYSVSIDMLEPGDAFQLALGPADAVGEEFGDVWAAVAPDSAVEILLDDVTICSGFVDDRDGDSSAQADVIAVAGRDRTGRLLDESAPLISFSGMDLHTLALRIVSPWFTAVEFSNATNRDLVRGKKRGAKGGRAYKEPDIPRGARAYRKVEPGETRWAVLEYFLRELELLAWAAADGKTLIIGRPNYDQEPSFKFFHARAGSPRQVEANCVRFSVHDSVAERYSQITAVGAQVNATGAVISPRRGIAVDGPGLDGVGASFQHPKRLLITDDGVKDGKQATIRAAREMAERNAQGHEITVSVAGHGQLVEGARAPTLYACDTMVDLESEVFAIKGRYLITSVNFRRDEQSGETTELKLVPRGTVLKA